MRAVYRFLKSTIIGGLVVLVPLIVLGALVGWIADSAFKAMAPVFELLPDKSVGGVSLTLLVAILSVVGLSFLAGLCAETAMIRFLHDRADRIALFVPGYALMKNVGANLVGIEGKHPAKTVLVAFEESWQLGFLMETLPDGRHVVFLPTVPRALVGTLHIFAPERVHLLGISVSAALDVLARVGVGLRDIWPAAPPGAGTT